MKMQPYMSRASRTLDFQDMGFSNPVKLCSNHQKIFTSGDLLAQISSVPAAPPPTKKRAFFVFQGAPLENLQHSHYAE